jgi:hypothetical protein
MILLYDFYVNIALDHIIFPVVVFIFKFYHLKSGGVYTNGANFSGFCSLFGIIYKMYSSESWLPIQTDKKIL